MNKLLESIYKTFGFQLKEPKISGKLESIDIDHEDGAIEVLNPYGGVVGLSSDLFHVPANEIEQIKTYRSLSYTSDVDRVLNEIRNEVLVFNVPEKKAIDIEFIDSKVNNLSKSLMDKIHLEYDTIYNILDFQRKGLDIFNKWYVDGRLFLHKIINKNKPKDGIQKIIAIDALKIKKVIEYPQPNSDGIYDFNLIKTYYIFSDVNDVFSSKLSRFMIINKDAIAYSDSGIYDHTTGAALSYLWKMIVPYNNMKMMEEALLIYRVVRSPERRVFYINVGNLSKPKAEQYMKELMAKFKNKIIYDAKTGSLADKKNIMSMVEDYWLPRRDDGKGTEIQSLPGATNLGTIDDVDLFRKKFLESSNVPSGRFKDETESFTFGRSVEISRDEYRFKKFLDSLRNRFILIFEDLLKTQLILKNIIVESDWENIRKSLLWRYAEDNNFVQWKEAEALNSKIESLIAVDQLVGKYFTRTWALKNIMKMGDDECEDILTEVDKEKEILYPPAQEGNPPVEENHSEETGNGTQSEIPEIDTSYDYEKQPADEIEQS